VAVEDPPCHAEYIAWFFCSLKLANMPTTGASAGMRRRRVDLLGRLE